MTTLQPGGKFSEHSFAVILFMGRYLILFGGIGYALYHALSNTFFSGERGGTMTFDLKSIIFSIVITMFAIALSQTVAALNKKVYGKTVISNIRVFFAFVFVAIFGIGGALIGGLLWGASWAASWVDS